MNAHVDHNAFLDAIEILKESSDSSKNFEIFSLAFSIADIVIAFFSFFAIDFSKKWQKSLDIMRDNCYIT